MNRKSSFLTIWIVAAMAVMALFGRSDVLALNPECAGSSPYVCVFKNGVEPDPEPEVDFRFDLTVPANPVITLLTGSDEWQVWSKVNSTSSTPGDIGDILIDASATTDNFEVTILDDLGGPGAANVGSIILSDATNWTGHSSITAKMSPQRHQDTKGSLLLCVFVPSGSLSAHLQW